MHYLSNAPILASVAARSHIICIAPQARKFAQNAPAFRTADRERQPPLLGRHLLMRIAQRDSKIYFTMLNDIVPDSVPRADCCAGVISSHSSTGLAPWLGVTIDGIFEGKPPAAARDICAADKGVKGIPTAVTSEEAKACEFAAP